MECKFKKAVVGKGECDLTYPSCLKKIGFCPIEDKYQEWLMDARIVAQELAEERGEYETD